MPIKALIKKIPPKMKKIAEAMILTVLRDSRLERLDPTAILTVVKVRYANITPMKTSIGRAYLVDKTIVANRVLSPSSIKAINEKAATKANL